MYNNGTTIEYIPSAAYVANYQKNMYGEEEKLLDRFANNQGYHTSGYNKLFNNIVFLNLCRTGLYDLQGNIINVEQCENFNAGILKQGLYVAVIKLYHLLY